MSPLDIRQATLAARARLNQAGIPAICVNGPLGLLALRGARGQG